MQFTPLSFIMGVIWNCIIILAVHFLRKRKFFLCNFGITTIILLYVFCIARIFFTFEFSFTKVVPMPTLYNDFYQTICLDTHEVANTQVNLFDVFLVVWAIGIVVCITWFAIRYFRDWRIVCRYERVAGDTAEKILQMIQAKCSRNLRVEILICPLVTIPAGIGFFRKKILIPDRKFTNRELHYILLHEYMHICNRDLEIKMLLKLYCCFFWWNPLAYLLKADVDQMLEMRCDLYSVSGMSKKSKAEYLTVIKDVLVRADTKSSKSVIPISTQMVRSKAAMDLIERYNYIAIWNPKSRLIFRILSIFVVSVIIVVSYTFILQPKYDPPEDDVVTESNMIDEGTLCGYILKHSDGSYSFIDDNGGIYPMQNDTADALASMGYEIQEESK